LLTIKFYKMRSPIFQKILDEAPVSVDIFVQKYTDLVMRIHEILDEKGITQAALAASMDKKPSEISKWLSGEHNFTLRSIAKLEAELGEELLMVTTKEKKVPAKEKVPAKKKVTEEKQASMLVQAVGN
jgi:transcriptional regulator with XRE-family HTH domain